MSGVSFIIPVLNEAQCVGPLLESLREQFPDSQLIVVDGGSSDGTVKAALPLCDQLLLGARGRAQQMNLGGRGASSPYLVFLHADTRPGISQQQLLDHLQNQPAWGFCRVRLSGKRPAFRIIEWCMNQRSRITAVATGDQMLFVSREVFESTGGFDEIPLMEDVAYSKRLRKLASPRLIDEPVVTSSRRWEEGGVVGTVVRMWLLRLAYFVGVSPVALCKHYYGR